MFAARNGHYTTVKALIDHGVQLDWVNKEGDTALMLACDFDHRDVVQVLLTGGASAGKAQEHTSLNKAKLVLIKDAKLESYKLRYHDEPIIVASIEGEQRWRRRMSFIFFLAWLDSWDRLGLSLSLEHPPTRVLVMTLLLGGPKGPIARKITQFL